MFKRAFQSDLFMMRQCLGELSLPLGTSEYISRGSYVQLKAWTENMECMNCRCE